MSPSSRDFEIFFAVAVEGLSTRRTAEGHHLSQTRVRQIVARVGDWIADRLPDPSPDELRKQARLAQHLAAARLQQQYEEVIRLWQVEFKPQYLRQATRITLAMARLGLPAGRLDALAAEAAEHPAEAAPNPPPQPASEPPASGFQPRLALRPFAPGRGSTGLPHPPPIDPSPPSEDCSLPLQHPFAAHPAAADFSPAEAAATPVPPKSIDGQSLPPPTELEGLVLLEQRLLTLLDSTPADHLQRRASLTATLCRIRAARAAAELRSSPFPNAPRGEPCLPLENRS